MPKCRELVLVAAPKDARSYFDYPESTSALVQRVADMQKAAGLNGLLVDARGSAVTVTGWVALACIVSLVVVIIGGTCICVWGGWVCMEGGESTCVRLGMCITAVASAHCSSFPPIIIPTRPSPLFPRCLLPCHSSPHLSLFPPQVRLLCTAASSVRRSRTRCTSRWETREG